MVLVVLAILGAAWAQNQAAEDNGGYDPDTPAVCGRGAAEQGWRQRAQAGPSAGVQRMLGGRRSAWPPRPTVPRRLSRGQSRGTPRSRVVAVSALLNLRGRQPQRR